ncbi:hypothetical protein DFH06DRAFT_1446373 [Mycena polygramma]|nr:hypothetical protein DFH06DRAFT_1446373 [Mycena polygramma]
MGSPGIPLPLVSPLPGLLSPPPVSQDAAQQQIAPPVAPPTGPSPPVLHEILLPGASNCPTLDFSLPSVLYDIRLGSIPPAVLNQPACSPSQTEMVVRVLRPHSASGLCRIAVKHTSHGGHVTVGDILRTVHQRLREPAVPTPLELGERRIGLIRGTRLRTLTLYSGVVPEQKMVEILCREVQQTDPLRLDRLLGQVQFAGIKLEVDGDGRLTGRLNLVHAKRYKIEPE